MKAWVFAVGLDRGSGFFLWAFAMGSGKGGGSGGVVGLRWRNKETWRKSKDEEISKICLYCFIM